MFSFLRGLECSYCGRAAPVDVPHTTCPACGKVLFARYDLGAVREALDRRALLERPPTLWRYHELLPVRDPANVVSLGEGFTPLLEAPRLGSTLGLERLLIKEEALNPTGSFKARGMAVAVSRAKELGLTRLAAPSAGNAGAALACYAARAGLEAWVFMPADTPRVPLLEAMVAGAHVYLVDGLINDAGRVVRSRSDWFDMSTLREPYRVEGKKTMGYELAEQLGWRLPDAIVYPTGGGTGLVGMWKAFAELEELGWIGDARPRMYSVQASGCAPIVRAYERGERHAEQWRDAQTIASGLRVPAAIGDYLILDAIRASGGCALSVTDAEIVSATELVGASEGIWMGPEGAATVAAVGKLRESGQVRRNETIVLFDTGAGILYPDLVSADLPTASISEPFEIAARN